MSASSRCRRGVDESMEETVRILAWCCWSNLQRPNVDVDVDGDFIECVANAARARQRGLAAKYSSRGGNSSPPSYQATTIVPVVRQS
jgi:hypothetical protein